MKHRHAEILRFFLAIISLLWASQVPALSSDRDQPIHVEADRVEIDEQEKTSDYTGNVRLRQGSLQLRADRLAVHRSGDSVQLITARGRPATFQQRADENDAFIRGEANEVLYKAESGTIELRGNAHLRQDRDEFSGARIVYELERDRVRAEGGTDNGRVRAIIHPKRENGDR